MSKVAAPRKYTGLGYPDYSQVRDDLTPLGVQNVGAAYLPSDLYRPDVKRLWMLTGGTQQSDFESGTSITTASSATDKAIGACEVWPPAFERGGYIEGHVFGKWTNTSASDALTLTWEVNDIATAANKITDHQGAGTEGGYVANAGASTTFATVFTAATASIASNATAGFVHLVFRYFSLGKTAQYYEVYSSIKRAGTSTFALLDMGETAIDHDWDSGARFYRLNVSVANANTTYLVRNTCGFQHGIRYGH